MTIACANTYQLEWLQAKLKAGLERVARDVWRRDVSLKFVVRPESLNGHSGGNGGGGKSTTPTLNRSQGEPRVTINLVEFDPTKRGYVQTSNYAWQFWLPLIKPLPFCVWNLLRSYAFQRSEANPSISLLADVSANSNRHSIRGRAASEARPHETIGALALLEEQRIIWVIRKGEGRHTTYNFKVMNSLPLLTSAQIAQLPQSVQAAHQKFLKRCQIDLDEWQQQTLPTFLPAEPPIRVVELDASE